MACDRRFDRATESSRSFMRSIAWLRNSRSSSEQPRVLWIYLFISEIYPLSPRIEALYCAKMIIRDNLGDEHVSLCDRCHLWGALLPMLQAEFIEHTVVKYPIQENRVFTFNFSTALIARLDDGHTAIKMYGPDGRLATWTEHLKYMSISTNTCCKDSTCIYQGSQVTTDLV